MLMAKNNVPVQDTIFHYFAAMDDYRYNLYNDLEEVGLLKYFPASYNNKLDLAKSKLMASKSYDKPDSLVYMNKLPAEFRSKQGYIYFFKYKDKKDDLAWKLASVGLIAKDGKQFDFTGSSIRSEPGVDENGTEIYDFTSFTDSKIKDDEPVGEQLNNALRRLLGSRRKSAKEFYDVSKNDLNEILRLKN